MTAMTGPALGCRLSTRWAVEQAWHDITHNRAFAVKHDAQGGTKLRVGLRPQLNGFERFAALRANISTVPSLATAVTAARGFAGLSPECRSVATARSLEQVPKDLGRL